MPLDMTRTPHPWRMEDLFTPGGQGRAHAAARRGDITAQQTLDQLRRAIADLATTTTEADQ